MKTLYPPLEPYTTRRLPVPGGHTLHIEECGHPAGLPVLFLHGGPGAGCEPWHRRFFDPSRYRVILPDQRGAGRSTPHAGVEHNTTGALVEDIETLREALDLQDWLVFGGSWGSTLALVYAETHPQRVRGLILRGIFLCRDEEIRWFYQDGANWLFPDEWEGFVAPIPPMERDDLVTAFHRRLFGADELARMAAAKAWSIWEGRTATLRPDEGVIKHFANPHTALSLARIENHYFSHQSFLEPNQILRNAARLANIPGVIVQGRYDVVCPLRSAWELHRAWPASQLHIIPDAGHSAIESGILAALVEATDYFAGC
ncbi:Proline iminopeptidase [Gammaproteobacteria bacterium]